MHPTLYFYVIRIRSPLDTSLFNLHSADMGIRLPSTSVQSRVSEALAMASCCYTFRLNCAAVFTSCDPARRFCYIYSYFVFRRSFVKPLADLVPAGLAFLGFKLCISMATGEWDKERNFTGMHAKCFISPGLNIKICLLLYKIFLYRRLYIVFYSVKLRLTFVKN